MPFMMRALVAFDANSDPEGESGSTPLLRGKLDQRFLMEILAVPPL